MITWICICAYLIVVTTILIPTGLVLSLSTLSWLGCLLSPPSVDLIPLLSVQFLSIVTRISSCRLYLLYFMYWSDLFIHSCIYARSDDGCGAMPQRNKRRVLEICNNCAWNATRRKFLCCCCNESWTKCIGIKVNAIMTVDGVVSTRHHRISSFTMSATTPWNCIENHRELICISLQSPVSDYQRLWRSLLLVVLRRERTDGAAVLGCVMGCGLLCQLSLHRAHLPDWSLAVSIPRTADRLPGHLLLHRGMRVCRRIRSRRLGGV